MVRMMNCPYCGTQVKVSSHWDTATCSSCHESFEIGVEIFEMTEEEQEKETKAAAEKIKEQEAQRAERAKETKRRLRAALHLPEADPHKDVKFEDDENKKSGNDSDDTSDDADRKKKIIVIACAAGVLLVFILIFGFFIMSFLGRNDGEESGSAQSEIMQQQADLGDTATGITEKPLATKQEHDGQWVDGFSIDSNDQDGEYKIDLQNSTTGEQKDVYLKPDLVEESSSQIPTVPTSPGITAPSAGDMHEQSTDTQPTNNGSAEGTSTSEGMTGDMSGGGTEETQSTGSLRSTTDTPSSSGGASTHTPADNDKDVINMLLNGSH